MSQGQSRALGCSARPAGSVCRPLMLECPRVGAQASCRVHSRPSPFSRMPPLPVESPLPERPRSLRVRGGGPLLQPVPEPFRACRGAAGEHWAPRSRPTPLWAPTLCEAALPVRQLLRALLSDTWRPRCEAGVGTQRTRRARAGFTGDEAPWSPVKQGPAHGRTARVSCGKAAAAGGLPRRLSTPGLWHSSGRGAWPTRSHVAPDAVGTLARCEPALAYGCRLARRGLWRPVSHARG